MPNRLRTIVLLTALACVTGAAVPARADAQNREYLQAGQFLRNNEYLVSGNKAFFAILQADGEFAVYKGSGPNDNRGLIFGGRRGGPSGQYFAIMQRDGNFVVYKGTGPSDNQGFWWHIAKSAPDGEFFIVMQGDGNLCVYKGAGPGDNRGLFWQSGTAMPVTWSSTGRRIHNKGYNGPLWWGYSNQNRSDGLWAYGGDPVKAQKWAFMPDGTVRNADNTTQCWGIPNTPYGGWVRVTLQPCDGSARQNGWAFSGAHITKSGFPNGPWILSANQSSEAYLSPSGEKSGMGKGPGGGVVATESWYNLWSR